MGKGTPNLWLTCVRIVIHNVWCLGIYFLMSLQTINYSYPVCSRIAPKELDRKLSSKCMTNMNFGDTFSN